MARLGSLDQLVLMVILVPLVSRGKRVLQARLVHRVHLDQPVLSDLLVFLDLKEFLVLLA
jgi:hypothetical protein